MNRIHKEKKGNLVIPIILIVILLLVLGLMLFLNSMKFTVDDLKGSSSQELSSSEESLAESLTESEFEPESESVSEPVSESQAESQIESKPESQPNPPVSSQSQQSQAQTASSSEIVVVNPQTQEDWRLVLVNKEHRLSEDYDVDLVAAWGNYKFDVRAADALQKFVSAAANAGYPLRAVSTYRSMQVSAQLYQNKVNQLLNAGMSKQDAEVEAARWVAPAGTSEHNTGLAVDMVSSDFFNYYPDLCTEFEEFDAFDWLYENCVDYGFILRYPKDKEDITQISYEPWHYRYVGVENAKKMRELGVCLEEYWAMNHG